MTAKRRTPEGIAAARLSELVDEPSDCAHTKELADPDSMGLGICDECRLARYTKALRAYGRQVRLKEAGWWANRVRPEQYPLAEQRVAAYRLELEAGARVNEA